MTPSEVLTASVANSVIGGLSSSDPKLLAQSMINTRRRKIKADSVTVIKGASNSPGHRFELSPLRSGREGSGLLLRKVSPLLKDSIVVSLDSSEKQADPEVGKFI